MKKVVKKVQKKEVKRKIQFKFYAPQAQDVSLVGTFNKWNPIKKKMKMNEKGEWLTRVILSEGEHQYKFIVDGEWINDPGAERFLENGVGGINSVKVV
ncbi:MAG: isoamylase early set domain-containing protein [Candidatus Margulisbacteria bacterium]|nr:isoamylase early set domain-containing protein [Candidatus Margulisiibacteriota bacterium]